MSETGENQGRDELGRILPGHTGNPNGRPKKDWTWRELLIDAAEEMHQTGEPKKKIMARKLIEKGLDADIPALKEFGDRIDGKASQGIELTGKDGGPVDTNLTVVFADAKQKSQD